jgi:hypothetical protein
LGEPKVGQKVSLFRLQDAVARSISRIKNIAFRTPTPPRDQAAHFKLSHRSLSNIPIRIQSRDKGGHDRARPVGAGSSGNVVTVYNQRVFASGRAAAFVRLAHHSTTTAVSTTKSHLMLVTFADRRPDVRPTCSILGGRDHQPVSGAGTLLSRHTTRSKNRRAVQPASLPIGLRPR